MSYGLSEGVYNIPDQDKPKEYMQFLAQHAITNKMWSENDADRLCKSAVHGGEEWVTVHSMWVATVDDLLLKYTRKEFKEDRRKSQKVQYVYFVCAHLSVRK